MSNTKDRRPRLWHFCGTILLLLLAGSLEAQPWVQTFNPIRTFWVSPSGTGNGTQSNPMSLSTAMNQAVAGDLYWLTAGTYNGQKTFTRNGSSSNPIVWRGVAGYGAIINGSISVNGTYNWVWGLDVKDPSKIGTSEGIALNAAGGHIINCIVHDIKGRVGIAAWAQGSGQVVYGNIVYKQIPNNNNPHNMYTQNDYSIHGYKYVVGNMLLDAWDATGNSYNFHAYSTNGRVTGFHAEKNIISRGKFLIGGMNLPADNEIVRQNYFWNGTINFGYDRPAQVKFENNYVGRSTLLTRFFWGKGETQYPQTAQSLYTGNEFHKPSGNHFEFRTSAWIPGLCNGCPEIRSGDSWNNNSYSSPFAATFFADNNNQGNVTFSEWKTFTSQAGVAFDTSSSVVTSSPNKVAVIKNDYESGRGHIAIFNWALSSTVVVDLSTILSNGTSYKVLNPRNMGSPVLQGTYNAPVAIPTGGAEFLSLLVLATGTPPPPPPGDTTPPNTTITSSVCGTTVGSSSVTINWTGTDNSTPTPSLVYSEKLDGGSWSSYTPATSKTYTNLTSGSHTVSVRAKDLSGNVDGSPATCTFTVNLNDTTPPVISNIQVTNIQSTKVTVSWTTNEASSSQVEYGLNPCPCSLNTLKDQTLVTSHSQMLTALLPNTTYHYRVKSWDAAGNLGVSSDRTFTTASGGNPPPPPPGDSTPPTISNISVNNIHQTDATITWNTNEASNTQVEYGLNPCPCHLNTAKLPNMVTYHTSTLSALTRNRTYHYRVKSWDAAGNLAISSDRTFNTAP
jgi:hypothetical protein